MGGGNTAPCLHNQQAPNMNTGRPILIRERFQPLALPFFQDMHAWLNSRICSVFARCLDAARVHLVAGVKVIIGGVLRVDTLRF